MLAGPIVTSEPALVHRFRHRFVKVEHVSGVLRSEQLEFPPDARGRSTWPCVHLDSPRGTCPFLAAASDAPAGPPNAPNDASARDRPRHKADAVSHTPPAKPRRLYCECCQTHFSCLEQHLDSPTHRNFARNDANYAAVDAAIASLTVGHLLSALTGPPSGPALDTDGMALFSAPVLCRPSLAGGRVRGAARMGAAEA